MHPCTVYMHACNQNERYIKENLDRKGQEQCNKMLMRINTVTSSMKHKITGSKLNKTNAVIGRSSACFDHSIKQLCLFGRMFRNKELIYISCLSYVPLSLHTSYISNVILF